MSTNKLINFSQKKEKEKTNYIHDRLKKIVMVKVLTNVRPTDTDVCSLVHRSSPPARPNVPKTLTTTGRRRSPSMPEKEKKKKKVDEEEKSGDGDFEELVLDPHLVRALREKSISNPTPIQSSAIPLILVNSDPPNSDFCLFYCSVRLMAPF